MVNHLLPVRGKDIASGSLETLADLEGMAAVNQQDILMIIRQNKAGGIYGTLLKKYQIVLTLAQVPVYSSGIGAYPWAES